jgi:Lrp/AsnC family leucine-responsive transcriptional regulator
VLKLDHIDKSILSLLQENARISLSEISSTVQLSVSAVSERLRRLEGSGLIQKYTAILDPHAFHKDVTVLVCLKTRGQDYQALYDYVMSTASITEFYKTAGVFDFAIKVITDSAASLDVILDNIRRMPCVSRVQSSLVLSVGKLAYSITPSDN